VQLKGNTMYHEIFMIKSSVRASLGCNQLTEGPHDHQT